MGNIDALLTLLMSFTPIRATTDLMPTIMCLTSAHPITGGLMLITCFQFCLLGKGTDCLGI